MDRCAVLPQMFQHRSPYTVHGIPVVNVLPGINPETAAHFLNLAHPAPLCFEGFLCCRFGFLAVLVILAFAIASFAFPVTLVIVGTALSGCGTCGG